MEYERKLKEFEAWVAAVDFSDPDVMQELERWLAELDELAPSPASLSDAQESFLAFKAFAAPLMLPKEQQDPRIQAFRESLQKDEELWTHDDWTKFKTILMQIQEEQGYGETT